MLRAMAVAMAVASTTARAATTTTTPRVLPHYTAAARRCTASQGACNARTLVRSAANGDSSSSSSYEVYPVIGDGRCLFRSIAVGRALAEIGERAEEIDEVVTAS